MIMRSRSIERMNERTIPFRCSSSACVFSWFLESPIFFDTERLWFLLDSLFNYLSCKRYTGVLFASFTISVLLFDNLRGRSECDRERSAVCKDNVLTTSVVTVSLSRKETNEGDRGREREGEREGKGKGRKNSFVQFFPSLSLSLSSREGEPVRTVRISFLLRSINITDVVCLTDRQTEQEEGERKIWSGFFF